MNLSLQRKLTIVVLLFYWPALFILAHMPIPQLIRRVGVSDKFLHYLVYLILFFLLFFSVSPNKKVCWRRAVGWWVLCVIIVYGVLDEWMQSCIAGRSASVMDFFADLAGAVTGLILFSFFAFYPALLVVTAIAIFLLTNLTRRNLSELLPITNTLFYLFAYGFFTILWIWYVRPLLKSNKTKWLMSAFALPAGLLFITKLFSVLTGRNFPPRDVVIAGAAIIAVVFANFLFFLYRGDFNSEIPPDGT